LAVWQRESRPNFMVELFIIGRNVHDLHAKLNES